MNTVLDQELMQALRSLDACTLANAIETLHERLRNEGFVDYTVRCLFPELPAMLGYAATVRTRGSLHPITAEIYPDRTDWWDYIESLPVPRVVVVEDAATQPGLCSLVGEVHVSILQALRCDGVVTNGSVRDIPAARAAGFHYFAGNCAVSHGYVHIVEFGRPVKIGGLTINSGDLLHGDLHGVQAVPVSKAHLIPQAAARLRAHEQRVISLCRSPGFTVEKLRSILAQDPS